MEIKEFWCRLFGHIFEFHHYENYAELGNGLSEATGCIYKCKKCGKIVRTNGESEDNVRIKGDLWL